MIDLTIRAQGCYDIGIGAYLINAYREGLLVPTLQTTQGGEAGATPNSGGTDGTA